MTWSVVTKILKSCFWYCHNCLCQRRQISAISVCSSVGPKASQTYNFTFSALFNATSETPRPTLFHLTLLVSSWPHEHKLLVVHLFYPGMSCVGNDPRESLSPTSDAAQNNPKNPSMSIVKMLLDSYTGTFTHYRKIRLVDLQIKSYRASHLKEFFFLISVRKATIATGLKCPTFSSASPNQNVI